MFEAFATERMHTSDGVTIHVRRGGDGPPLLLLHGAPQTHAMWDRVAAELSRDFELVVPDLRGYGASDKPPSPGGDHAWSSFRAMAQDQVDVMQALGHARFKVAGHDRGGRTGHRLALDHPHAVEQLAVLDIVPTHHVFTHVDRAIATAYYHWFFLIQPEPVPERMLACAPVDWLHAALGGLGTGLDAFMPDAVAAYEDAIRRPDTIHGLCEDYRAAATVDFELDDADHRADRRIEAPLLVLWGANGVVGRLYEPLDVWRAYAAAEPTGEALDAGHYLAEERPAKTTAALRAFFTT